MHQPETNQTGHQSGMYVQARSMYHHQQPPIKKPEVAVRYIRDHWDESLPYEPQIAVLMLNDFKQPIGVEFIPIFNGQIVNFRSTARKVVKANAACVYISINTLYQHPKAFHELEPEDLRAMHIASEIFAAVDIGTMGYFVINCWGHKFIDWNQIDDLI